MAVLVARDAFEVLVGQELGQSLGHDDHAVLLAFPLTRSSWSDDPLDDVLEVHHFAGDRLAGLRVGEFLGRPYLPMMSSTLITRLASPAIAAP